MNIPPGSSGKLDRSVGRSAFGADAAGYHDARSGYPVELFSHLSELAVPNPRILEIGAGTGLATQGLLTLAPCQLTIVEPDPRLCQFLEDRFSSGKSHVVCGTFPDTDVEGPFDHITCAAAFHWMEPVSALARIRSLLVPGGVWTMWWNCYFGEGEPDTFGERVLQILEAHEVALPPSYTGRLHYSLDVGHHISLLERCGFREAKHRIFRNHRILDASQARALYQSFSFIRVLEDAARKSILDEIGILVDKDFGGQAESPVVTSLFCATH